MNKTFVKKMVQAKKLQLEAIKEIMPEQMKNRLDKFEKESFDLMKDIAFEILKESAACADDEEEGHKAASKKTKKINVDFN